MTFPTDFWKADLYTDKYSHYMQKTILPQNLNPTKWKIDWRHSLLNFNTHTKDSTNKTN